MTHPGCPNVSFSSKYLLHQWKCFHRCNKTNICFGMGGTAIRCFICHWKQPDLGTTVLPGTNQGGDFCSLKKTLSQEFHVPRVHSVTQLNATEVPCSCGVFFYILNHKHMIRKVCYLPFNLLPRVFNYHAAIRFF